ncbi:NUMOD4 motif-containing HNH endonuclease [Sphingobium sp. CFD-1]|uniref:NUMOD4 motif-containing HNH endonuclease n=1 Tax=Sphingobium sp. CFD-1 TaxID=2878545 RepID=UPI00214B68E0|nr:NUMOD4 motif-containing HNH endonuclease [Sphingobium sp. CFD-1]
MADSASSAQSDYVKEEWRPVVGREGLYEVSSLGNIRSLERTVQRRGRQRAHLMLCQGRQLKPYTDPKGYLRVGIGKKGSRLLHQIVCEAFHGRRPPGHEVAHIDGDRCNPSASNLRWATHRENMADREMHGTKTAGERHPQAKLSASEVADIRASPEMGTVLAYKYGVSKALISMIKSGRTRNVPGYP